jgi:hypothetical protein
MRDFTNYQKYPAGNAFQMVVSRTYEDWKRWSAAQLLRCG